MSQTEETTQATEETQKVFTREDGSQYTEVPFSLKSTKEIADRFKGDHTVTIPLPVAQPGLKTSAFLADGIVSDGLTQTLMNLAAFVDPEADFAEVLVGKFNGQGIRLDIQKEVKDFLKPRPTDDTETIEVDGEQVLTREAPVEAMLAQAQTVARAYRLGAPRKKGTGAANGKVAAAEAKAAKTANTAVSMYAALPKELRAQYREALLATSAITAEELDAVDQADEEKSGVGSGGSNKGKR